MKKLILEQVQAYGEGLMRWVESGEISMGDILEGKSLSFTHLLSERSSQRSCRFQFQRDVFRGTLQVSKYDKCWQ